MLVVMVCRPEAVLGSACDTVGVGGNGLYRPETVIGSAGDTVGVGGNGLYRHESGWFSMRHCECW